MNVILTELIKLKRSLSWAVTLALPVVLVFTGSIMTLIDGRGLDDGWHTLWMRSIVFYGLFPLPTGIAILASLIWRAEHRGSNWNALMSSPASSLRIVLGKAVTIAILASLMQIVAVTATIVLGKLAFGLPGFLPSQYMAVSIVIMIASVPVATLQSWLSMQMRSFAVPVAVAFLGSGFSAFLLAIGFDAAAFISPYAALSRATQLGTATFADTGDITIGMLGSLTFASIVLSAVLAAASALILDRSDAKS